MTIPLHKHQYQKCGLILPQPYTKCLDSSLDNNTQVKEPVKKILKSESKLHGTYFIMIHMAKNSCPIILIILELKETLDDLFGSRGF